MRISTQQIYEGGASRISEIQTALYKTQQQVATGRRMLAPSDDPVAAARALDLTQQQSINSQYAANRTHARNTLGFVEGTLSSVTEVLQQVKEAIVGAGNPLYDDAQRATVATELSTRFDAILGLANTRDAQGNYLFSGYQSDTPAFVESASGATYQGDLGQLRVQVDANRQMVLNSPGQTVFQGGGQDIFQTLKDAIALLQTPVVTAADRAALDAGLATANADLELALDNVLTVRAALGTRLQELDSLDAAGDDRNVQYSAMLSEIQDLDYARALTTLAQQETTLEAAQQSFVKTSALSLFNYL
ncbi:MAG: flagellar hook-associated protein FlgL [Pseudomonadota bacterium]